jgi:hypothetical protein
MPPLLKMQNFMQRTGCKLYDAPLKPVSIILAVKVYGAAKNSSTSTNLEITMVVGTLIKCMIAVIRLKGTNQNTISIVEGHN